MDALIVHIAHKKHKLPVDNTKLQLYYIALHNITTTFHR